MDRTTPPIRMLILGTGNMARAHATAFAKCPGVRLVRASTPDRDILAGFCKKHAIPHGFATLDEALAWGAFDAVANVTPDGAHTRQPCRCSKPENMSVRKAVGHKRRRRGRDGRSRPKERRHRHGQSQLPERWRVAAGFPSGRGRRDRRAAALRGLPICRAGLTQPAWGDWHSESHGFGACRPATVRRASWGTSGIHIFDFTSFAANSPIVGLSCRLKTFHKVEGDRIGDYLLDANDSFTLQAELANGALGYDQRQPLRFRPPERPALRLYGDRGGLEVRYEKQVEHLRLCADPIWPMPLAGHARRAGGVHL